MRLVYLPQATANLYGISAYSRQHNSKAATATGARSRRAIAGLALFPERGSLGRRVGTRELLVSGTPYLVAYRLVPGRIEILAIRHGARQWPAEP